MLRRGGTLFSRLHPSASPSSAPAAGGHARRGRGPPLRTIGMALGGMVLLSLALYEPARDLAYATVLVGQEPLRWFLLYDSRVELSIEGDGFDVTFQAYPANQQSAAGPNEDQGQLLNSTWLLSLSSADDGVMTAFQQGGVALADVPGVVNTGDDLVPPIIHHIVLGMEAKPAWLKARDTCLEWHPTYDYMFWDDARAEQLIQEDFPDVLDTWKGYKFPIQRADSLRYMVMYKYGGIFLDMDLECRRSLGPLRRFGFVAPAATPSGVSNGFWMTKPRHPFVGHLVDHLRTMDRNWFFLPYAAVMFSTGCFYFSAIWAHYWDVDTLRVLTGPNGLHKLSGAASTPLFVHLGSSSWHSYDAHFLNRVANWFKNIHLHPFRIGMLTAFLIVFVVLSTFAYYLVRMNGAKVLRGGLCGSLRDIKPCLPRGRSSQMADTEEVMSLLESANTPARETTSFEYRL